ncbi:MAG: UDP-N-acetylmuramoyl-tripeptide--D-alanyl-D-alanine ligase [Planctomycetota bacterium]|jgi:UDP-N-acetylmuramoyl-tripeptide--D-alanyl-D-alanine ligase
MTPLTPERARAITGGRWVQPPAAPGAPLRGVGIDTREDLAGRLFAAIRGERHDGHAFLADAAAAGATVLMVEADGAAGPGPAGPGILAVDDTRRALGALGRARRDDLAGAVVAITGSAGKTTTKDLLHAALGTTRRGTAAPRSFNNDIGVPLTLLAADPADEYVIVEIGTNAPGEIDALAALTRPDVAVVTLVGHGHLEGLGTPDDVAVEKGAILRHVRPGGLLVLPDDEPRLEAAAAAAPGRRIVRFGEGPGADVRVTGRGPGWVEVDGCRLPLPLPGRHNARNAAAALAVARHLGVADADAGAGLAAVAGPAMRLERRRAGGVEIINDAYNANPDSMAAALDTLGELAPDAARRIVVLGDMLELGAHAEALHGRLGEQVVAADRRAPIAEAVLVGPHGAAAARVLRVAWGDRRVLHVPTLDEAALARIAERIRPGDVVLVKGSRAMALERLVDHLETRRPRPAGAG